jgi:hypothetical protein
MPRRIRVGNIAFNLNDDRLSPGFLCRIAHITENFAYRRRHGPDGLSLASTEVSNSEQLSLLALNDDGDRDEHLFSLLQIS